MIGNGVSIGHNAVIEPDVKIGDYVAVGERAFIARGSCLERDNYLHLQLSRYTVDAYLDSKCRPVLRFGCETHLLSKWTSAFQRKMCAQHDPKTAPELARVVRMLREFFKGKK